MRPRGDQRQHDFVVVNGVPDKRQLPDHFELVDAQPSQIPALLFADFGIVENRPQSRVRVFFLVRLLEKGTLKMNAIITFNFNQNSVRATVLDGEP